MRLRLAIASMVLLVTSGALAGDRDLDLVLANGSEPSSDVGVAKLLDLFQKDIMRLSPKPAEETHIAVLDTRAAAKLFEPGCGGKVRDAKAFDSVIRTRVSGDMNNDALIFFCYDAKDRAVSLVMFDDDGSEVLRVITKLESATGMPDPLLSKKTRTALIRLLLDVFPWDV